MTTFKDLQHGTVNPFQPNTKAISYSVDKTLEQGVHRIDLITNGTYTLGFWLDDIYVGMFCDNSLTFELANDVYVENVVIKEYNELGEIESVKLASGSNATEWTPAPEDFNNLKGKSYALSQPLRKENILSLNGSFEEDDFIGLWLGNDKFVGFLDNQELTFNLTENYDDEFVVVKALSEKGIIDNAKLEKGNVAHRWTPAPEDKSIPKIRFFEHVKIISKPHEIDDSMLIKKQTIHLDDPSQNTIEVGVEVSSFTDKQLEANNTIKIIKSDYVTNEKMTNVVNPLNIQISTILQESVLIKLSVERLNSKTDNLLFDSILTNANGELGSYQGWKDFASNDGIIFFDELKFLENMTFATLFEILKDNGVLGGVKLSFFGNGKQEYGLRPIVGGYDYSYRAKRVKGTQSRTVEINEYDSNQVYLRKRSFIFDGTDTYEDIPNLSFGSDVKFISITYIISGVSVSNRLEIAETMFAIGDPKPYVKSADSVANWAESEFKMLADEINLKVNADGVVSAINLQPGTVKIDAKNLDLTGLVTIANLAGNGTTVINGNNITTGTISADRINFNGATGTDVDLSGKITADSGKIGGYTISGDNLVGNEVTLGQNQITIGGSYLRNSHYESGRIEVDGNGLDIKGREGYGTSIRLKDKVFVLNFGNSPNHWLQNIRTISASPDANNIGDSNNRFESIYLKNQPNVSSDIRQKYSIQEIPKDLIKVLYEIKPKMYLQGKEWHFGYIAQDVERALYLWATSKYGLEAKYYVDKFAMLHKDESHLSLLYGEIAVLKERAMSDRISKLERELQEIKELLRKENVNGL